MDFKQLEALITVAKLKSFSKAAEELYITQPTVSNQISNLEKELNTTLINRNNKSVSLTKAGNILYQYALDILNKRDHAMFSLDQFKGKIEGELEIASSSVPERFLLPDIILDFSRLYKNVKYNIKKYDTGIVLSKILNGEIDFGIVGAKKPSKHLNYIEIMSDEIVLVAPNSGVYKDIDSLDIQDVVKHPLIMREDGSATRNILLERLTQNSINVKELRVIAVLQNSETIMDLVANNLGISFISNHYLDTVSDDRIKVIQLKNMSITRKFYFVYHNSRALSPLAEKFQEFILNTKDK